MAVAAMMTLGKLIECIEPARIPHLSEEILKREISGLSADSREVSSGGVFVAVRGALQDGHNFVDDALSRGCIAIIHERPLDINVPGVILIPVADSAAAFSHLAAVWHGNPAEKLCLIGITGTNGKTTTTWLLEQILLAAGIRFGVIGTVNYRYHDEVGTHILQDAPLTTPGPMLLQKTLRTMAEHGVTHVILEVSSHALDQQRLGPCRFDVAVFTNLTRDHLDYHQNMDAYFEAKLRLFTSYLKERGKAVLVASPVFEGHDWSAAMAARITAMIPARPLMRCGFSVDCDLQAEALTPELTGFHCVLRFHEERISFRSHLTGRHNALNALAAAACGLSLGLDLTAIVRALERVNAVPGRLERVSLPSSQRSDTLAKLPEVFVDYAHTPDALDNVLAALRPLTKGKVFCVFGCGGNRDAGKRPIMGRSAASAADLCIITSDNPRGEDPLAIIAGIVDGVRQTGRKENTVETLFAESEEDRSGYVVIPERSQAIQLACDLAGAEDIVLIAGKGHESYQQIGTEKYPFDDRLEAKRALMGWHARHLLAAVTASGGRVVSGKQTGVLRQVSTDSRAIQDGDIFVALQGEHFDGHDYIAAAVDKGAGAVIGQYFPSALPSGVLCIQVRDTLQALGALAAYRRRLLSGQLKLCAITGSSGKSTVKELLAAIFTQALQAIYANTKTVLKTKGNFNNLVGLPLSLLELDAAHLCAVLEMGMSTPGEIETLTRIADPDIGCINNVHPAHLQGLGSIEGIAAAKAELFITMRPEAIRVVNCDDSQVRRLAHELGLMHDHLQTIRFACTTEGISCNPQIWISDQQNLGPSGMLFTLHIGDWSASVKTSLPGEHNVQNCAAAAAMAHAAGIDPAQIVSGLQHCSSFLDKRLALIDLPGGLHVANDSYNANPISMAAGLRTVAAFDPDKRHVAALGDMLELGAESAELHRGIGRQAAQLGYDYLMLIGDQAQALAQGATEAGNETLRIRIFSDFQDMASWVEELREKKCIGPGDWLFIKGSRGMRMERLIEELEHRSADRKIEQ